MRFLRLGLSAFGGPVAHLGYFRREFVEREGWLDDAAFGEIVALCSALPGPTSSQVGITIGTLRAGPLGGLAAWLAFTTPSALALALFGIALRAADAPGAAFAHGAVWRGALEGLAGAAAAVVVLAVAGLAATLTRTTPTRALGVLGFVLALAVDRYAPGLQWLPLLAGGALGAILIAPERSALPQGAPWLRGNRPLAIVAFAALLAGLIGLPLAAPAHSPLALFALFFRAGSLVFGGGHVVLPFLQSLVGPQLVPARDFFAGYAAAQAVPGPLFTFASFLGAANHSAASGVFGALVATLGIFAPSFLLLAMALPLWSALRAVPRASAVLAGVNASVVGLLAAVLVYPLGANLIASPIEMLCAAAALPALRAKAPAWLVVFAAAGLGALAGAFAGAR